MVNLTSQPSISRKNETRAEQLSLRSPRNSPSSPGCSKSSFFDGGFGWPEIAIVLIPIFLYLSTIMATGGGAPRLKCLFRSPPGLPNVYHLTFYATAVLDHK